jgi:hypothetical protein
MCKGYFEITVLGMVYFTPNSQKLVSAGLNMYCRQTRQFQHGVAWLECVVVQNASFSMSGMCRGPKRQFQWPECVVVRGLKS